MKNYEMLNELQKKVNWARNEFDTMQSRAGHIKHQYELLLERNRNMEASLLREVNENEEEQARRYDYLQACKEELQAFKDNITPTKIAEPVLQENGKKLCDLCKQEFASQGYPAHRKKCERIHELEKELAELEEEE